MAKSGTPPRPTSTLALISTGEALPVPLSAIQDLGGTIAERLEARSPKGVSIDALGLEANTHNLGRELDPLTPTYTCLTHPVTGTEPFRPYASEKTILGLEKQGRQVDPRAGIMGRILDLDVQNFKAGLGGPDTGKDEKWTMVDEHWVSGWVGMTIDAADAAKEGYISPFTPLLMNPQRDAHMVWRRDMTERRYDGELGEWIFHGLLSSAGPQPEDAAMWYWDFSQRDPTEAPVKLRFVDPLSLSRSAIEGGGQTQEEKHDANLVDKLLGKNGNGRDFGRYVSALSRAAFVEGYDPQKDDIPQYIRDEVESAQRLLDLSDPEGATTMDQFWRFIVPAGLAKMIGRTVQLLDELNTYKQDTVGASPKRVREDLAEHRRRIAQEFVAGVRYYSIIHKTYTQLPYEYADRFYEKNILGTDVPPFENPMLLDFMVVDDIDRTTLNPGKMADIIANRQYQANMIRKNASAAVDRVKRRVHDPNSSDMRLVVRAWWGDKMRVFSDLDATRRNYTEQHALVHNGLNDLEAGALGAVYPDEILRSVADPIEEDGPPESQRFGLGGLAMLGVEAMIEVDTKSGTEAFLITSAKRQPHGLNRAILGQYHTEDRTVGDLAHLLTNGRTGLTRTLAAEHEHRTRMVGVKGRRPQDITIKSPPLRNGDTLTVAVDSKGSAPSTTRLIGEVKGQKPAKRRVPPTLEPRPITASKVTRKDLSQPQAQSSRVTDTEIILANNRTYLRDGRRRETSGRVNLYKRTIAPKGKGRK